MTDTTTKRDYKRADFQTDQEVRWCPGCGDYTILAAVQSGARLEVAHLGRQPIKLPGGDIGRIRHESIYLPCKTASM